MPLPGGATDKIGNRFELWWTLRCMFDVLKESANTIYLEPLGREGDGVEFILKRGVVSEYHQVKRQYSKLGRWSLAAMENERVLSRFWDKLRTDASSQCHFVSTVAADELQELTENARSAADLAQFQREFVGRTRRHTAWFGELRRHWLDCTEQEAYNALQRVFVRAVDEYTLREEVEYRLETLVSAPPGQVSALLMQHAFDKIHHLLRAFDLWNFLDSNGIRRREWNNDPHIETVVAAQNARYLEPLRRNAVAGFVIDRPEVTQIAQLLQTSNAKQGIMVSGEAGVGKSGVGLQIVDAMRQRGWPVLAFRIDQFATMQSPKDVGRQLELPESPVTVLANIAQSQPSLLVIDQLDAISQASGRNTQFFDCVAELLQQVKRHSAMRVVLLCRKFDIINDDRLRKLTGEHGFAQEVTIARLNHDTVRSVAASLHLAVYSLTPTQLDLLSIPLHLKLLSEVVDNESIRRLDFITANDLFGAFWDHKRRILSERIGRSVAWVPVINALCENMSETRRLFAPRSLLEMYRDDAEAMVSERVLIANGPHYQFFHESFFDYAFARLFVASNNSLISLLTTGEQHLFRRAQVRQILAYSREANEERYLLDLNEALSNSGVRFHIKQVVFAFLRQQSAPKQREWNIIAPFLEDVKHQLHGEAWHLLTQLTWFRYVASLGIIETWLTGDAARIDQTIRLFWFIAREAPDEIAAYLESRDPMDPAWRTRLRSIFSWADLSKSRRLFELFVRRLQEGVLEGVRSPIVENGDFWLLIYPLIDDKPEWYCEALGAYLRFHLELNMARGVSNPFASSSGKGTIGTTQHGHYIVEVAKESPLDFAAHVFDFVLQVAEANATRDGVPPHPDTVWDSYHYEGVYSTPDILLHGLEIALRQMAVWPPEKLGVYVERLRASDTRTAQYLLVRTYTANGQRFADDAAIYLCENPERLCTGWSGEYHRAARLLIEAITPYCSQQSLHQLETAVMAYFPRYERSAVTYRIGGGTRRGWSQFGLLNGISSLRRSHTANRRLKEWQRKFQSQDEPPMLGMQTGPVDSPVRNEACRLMTDTQWLSAIAKYSDDQVQWNQDSVTGGAPYLAQQLEERTKQEPTRFADLLLNFPVTTHLAYFDAILRGLREADHNVETALKICRVCHSLPGRPCGRQICSWIEEIGKQTLPEELLAMVAWYATEDGSPQAEEVEEPSQSSAYDLEFKGINSTRGAATRTIAHLIFDDSTRAPYFMAALELLKEDTSLAVRACAARAFTAVLNADRNTAVRLFLEMVADADDALLTTSYVSDFLYYALYTHFKELKPVLERMLVSSNPHVAKAGAERACLIALSLEEAVPLAERTIVGTQAQREGAAKIFAHNVVLAENRILCESALINFFSDEEAEVRSAASYCFEQFKEEELQNFSQLVEAFVSSPSVADNSSPLLHALVKTTAKLPDVTCDVCEGFLAAVGNVSSDLRTDPTGDASVVSKLVIRTYEQTNDVCVQSRCLDIIDKMTQLTAHGIHEELTLVDR